MLLCLALVGCNEADEGDTLADLRACEPQPACGSVSSTCGEDLQPCPQDEDAVCTLEGLRDRARGVYVQLDCEGGCAGSIVFVAGPEAPVQRQSYHVEYEGSSEVESLGDIEQCQLRADAEQFFQDCLDTPDSTTCLAASQWVMDCAPAEHPNCF